MTEDLRNNENRARFKNDSINAPSDCSSLSRPPSPGAMPPPLRGDAPMTLDPHFRGRGHQDNATVRPPERPRASYTREIQRRETRVVDKYK
jgi:hypothetical protein